MPALRSRARVLLFAVATAMVAGGLGLLSAPAALAAVPTPVFPRDGEVVEVTPVLRWGRLPDATQYDVQVAGNAAFTSPLVDTRTRNSNYAPTVPLPEGDLWWRVRVTGTDSSGWVTETFRRGNLPVPTVLGPTGVLTQPSDPPIVRWTSVPGARSYVLQLSLDEDFADEDAITTLRTSTTSGAIPTLQVPGDWFSRVRADFGRGVLSQWSTNGAYTIAGLPAPDLVSPQIGAQLTDVVLDWKPVEGAATYEVEVDDAANFESPVFTARGVRGTRISPPKTIGNDDYWWRVRPVDAAGNFRPWAQMPLWTFTRVWRGQPRLEYPLNNQNVSDELYYQWSASRTPAGDEDLSLSSRYTVELSTTASFNEEDIVDRCETVGTTFVPGSDAPGQSIRDCFPAVSGRYYWRVISHDDFSGARPTNEPASRQVRSFVYQPGAVQAISPIGGAQVTVPTLRWRPQQGAARYKVSMTNLSNGETHSATTAASSYTPREQLSEGTWAWQVQTVSVDNRLGVQYITGLPTFRLSDPAPGTATRPTPVDAPTGIRFPTLRWQPVANADAYVVWAKAAASPGYQQITDETAYPAVEDLGSRFLEPGDYDFFVQALRAGTVISTGQTGRFTIDPLEEVASAQQWAALTGQLLPDEPTDRPGDPAADTCNTQVQSGGAQSDCDNLRGTPVLNWPTTPNAGYYNLYLAYDKAMTNPVYDRDNDGVFEPVVVSQPVWTPSDALPDSTAGTAYYYLVVPCSFQTCEALRPATNSFDKLSRGVVLKAPTMGKPTAPAIYTNAPCPVTGGTPVCADDVTLNWEDFRISQETPVPGTDPDRPFDPGTPLQEPSRTEAQYYRVQTATDASFLDVIETVQVDQTTFTSAAETYPEGPVFWRVQAVDGSGNTLAWSDPGEFVKRSPVPLLSSPVEDDSVPGDLYFSWQPRRFAAEYRIELYKNNDSTGSPANLVTRATVSQRVASLTKPLPVAATPYTWRVRRVDARGRTGDWSAWGSFTVTPTAPALDQPNQGALDVAPSDAVFRWGPVAGAGSYRFERLSPGTTTVVESQTTSSLAWAPTNPIPGGQWDWRVTALDAVDAPLGTSQIRRFTVTDTVTATTPVRISGSGRVGSELTATAPNWNFTSAVTTTYQWYRGTSAISGATGTSYEVTSGDVGKSLSVLATGTRAGYQTGTSRSDSIVGVAGDAPIAVSDVEISGTGKVGTELTSTPPEWDDPAVTTTYQWQRNGANIGGATRTTYAVTPADVGTALQLIVTGTRTGFSPGRSGSRVVTGALGDAPAASTPVSINIPGTRIGTTVSLNPPTWNQSGVSTSYQWFRDAAPITGSTGTSYRLADADLGRTVTVRAVGSRSGYESGTSTSNPVVVSDLDALVASMAPSIAGTPAVKQTLTAGPGTWSVASGISYAYQWFVNGQPVSTRQSYTVAGKDAGLPVTVQVTASASGWKPGVATSAPVVVAKMASTTTASLAAKKILQRDKPQIRVEVDLADYSGPLGAVQVTERGKVLATVDLSSGKSGELTIKLKKLKKGKHKLTVSYTGSATTLASQSATLKLKVVKGKKKR